MIEPSTADVAIWGRIPPPIGGMAVHLRRLLPHLADAGIRIQMYSVGRPTPEHPQVTQVSHRRLRWLFDLMTGPCEPIHYVLSDNSFARFAASLLSFFGKSKVVLRIGGESLEKAAGSNNILERLMVEFSVRQATAVVGVSERICSLARAMGARRVVLAPGFIPESCDAPLPSEVEDFLAQSGSTAMLASGEVHDPKNDDLYGAYMLLDLLELAPDARLVFYAYRITSGSGPEQLLAEEIRKRGLQDRFLLFRSSTDLQPAMRRCGLLIRPTTTDGDSNAIREALHLGLPVIASDCVDRPKGTIIFPTGNIERLHAAVSAVRNDLDGHRRIVRTLPKHDHAGIIVALFKDLVKR